MPNVLIVGASRGIGLGLVKEYRSRGVDVVGTVRNAAQGEPLTAAGATVEIVDVTDAASRANLVGRLADQRFDAVVINAGVSGPPKLWEADDADVAKVMHANAIGPAQLAYALLGHVVPHTGVVAFTTSQMGSIADSGGGYDAYRASKAALNAFARAFFVARAKVAGVAVLSMHPGWVKTDMGGQHAPLSVEDSARGMAEVIDSKAGVVDHVFLDYAGKSIPW